MKWFLLFLVVYLTTGSAIAQPCRLIPGLVRELAELRGQTLVTPVGCAVIGKEAIEKFILSQIELPGERERLLFDQTVLRSLGLIAPEADLLAILIKLYTAQVAGLYDPKSNRFIVAEKIPESLVATVAAHELIHALQDQLVDLEAYTKGFGVDGRMRTTDELLARMAVVEGDAMLGMLDREQKIRGLPRMKEMASVGWLVAQQALLGQLTMVGDTPPVLTKTLLFPYASGLRYVHSVYREEGNNGIEKRLRIPPNRTAEILKPGLVLPPPQARTAIQDSLGMFLFSVFASENKISLPEKWLLLDDVVSIEAEQVTWRAVLDTPELCGSIAKKFATTCENGTTLLLAFKKR